MFVQGHTVRHRSLIDQSGIVNLQRDFDAIGSLRRTFANIRESTRVRTDVLRVPNDLCSPLPRIITEHRVPDLVEPWRKLCSSSQIAAGSAGISDGLRSALTVQAATADLFKSAHQAMYASGQLDVMDRVSKLSHSLRGQAGIAAVAERAVRGSSIAGLTRAAQESWRPPRADLVLAGSHRIARGLNVPTRDVAPWIREMTSAIHQAVGAARISMEHVNRDTNLGVPAPMFANRALGFLYEPAVDLAGIFKAAPGTSEIANAVDALFDALRSVASGGGVRAWPGSSPEHARAVEDEQEDEHPERQAARGKLIWAPGAPRILEPHVPLRPVRFFFGSSRKDDQYKAQLMSHLSVLIATKAIEPWSEADLLPGDDGDAETAYRLEMSRFIVLLLSADYIEEIQRHDQRMMRRLEERARQATVIPVLVRPVDIRRTFLERISPLPSDGQFVTTWNNLDAAWYDVARAIHDAVEACRDAARHTMH